MEILVIESGNLQEYVNTPISPIIGHGPPANLANSFWLRLFTYFLLIGVLVTASGCAGLTHKKEKRHKPEIKSRLKTKKPRRVERIPEVKKGRRSHARRSARPADHETRQGSTGIPQLDVKLNKQYFTSFVTDTYEIVTSPLHWDKRDWLTFGLIGGTTVALGFLDETVREELAENPSQTRKDFLKIGQIAGDGGYAAAYLSLFYVTGLLREDEELQSTALLATESFLISSAFTLTLKHLFGRQRPTRTTDADNFDGPFSGGTSLPSGHTTTAFSIATVFAKQYERHVWVPPLAYTLATMTALSRINDGVHWTSDVFLGAAIGYFTASALHKIHNQPNAPKLMVRPMISSNRQGLAVDYQF